MMILAPQPLTLCVGIELTPGKLCLIYPVGQEVCATVPSVDVPDVGALVRAAIGQFQTALAPIQPVLDIASLVVLLAEIVKDIATGQFADAIKKGEGLSEALAKLLKLVPQMAIPVLLASAVDLAILAISTLRQEVDGLVSEIAAAINDLVSADTAGHVVLAAGLTCHIANLKQFVARTGQSSEPFQQLLCSVSRLCKLVGIPFELPHFGELLYETWEPVNEALLKIEALLRGVRLLIPLPSAGQEREVC